VIFPNFQIALTKIQKPLQELEAYIGIVAPQPRALTADLAAITSNTLAAISGLSQDVESAKIYKFEFALWVTDSNAEGIKLDLNGGTAAMTWFRAKFFGLDADTVAIVQSTTTLASAVNRDSFSGMVQIWGAFSPSGDGTFIPRVAQKAHASGSLTVLKGSSSLVQETR
jgi:hypothetical protein